MFQQHSPYSRTSHTSRPTTLASTTFAYRHTQPLQKKRRFETFQSPSKTIPMNNLNLPLSKGRSHCTSVQDCHAIPLRTTTLKTTPTATQAADMSHPPSLNHDETKPTIPPPMASSCPSAEEAPDDVVMYDDIERLVCHEDMPQLLVLAANVKQLYHSLTLVPAPTPVKASQMDPREVLAVVDRIQRQLCTQQKPTVHRGTFPLTDSILEESLLILQTEVERCEQHLRQRQEAAFHQRTSSEDAAEGSPRRRTATSDDASTPTTSNGIATKYSKWQTDVLMEWMMDNKAHPFPTPAEVEDLAQRTCLVPTQIVNWTTNVRKRNWKATVAQGKKPHHFIDFLFLAQDRDHRNALDEANERKEGAVINTPTRRGRSKTAKPGTSSRKKGVTNKADAVDEETRVDDDDDVNDQPASELPCQTPKGTSNAVSPSGSAASSGAQNGMGDTPKLFKQESHSTSTSFAMTPPAKGSFVSPYMSPAPHQDYRFKHQQHYGSGEMMPHPQPPPSPYRVTRYHYSQRQSHVPTTTPFLPRPCGMSSDYYFYNPMQPPVASSSTRRMSHYHDDNNERYAQSDPHEGQLHSVSESFDNNSNDAALMGPTDPLDPWGDEENECAHVTGNAGGPSALMDAFANYWFEKCQDHDDDEDEDDDKSVASASSSKTIPTGPRRFDLLESPFLDEHEDSRHQQHGQHHQQFHMNSWKHHHTQASAQKKSGKMKGQELQLEVAVGYSATVNLTIKSGKKSPPRRAAKKDSEREVHTVNENMVNEQSKKQVKKPANDADAVKGWQHPTESNKADSSKCSDRMKRQRSASFDDDDDDDDDEEEWTTASTLTTNNAHDGGLDVADFIRELGLEESHE